jgi:hypothetical protein
MRNDRDAPLAWCIEVDRFELAGVVRVVKAEQVIAETLMFSDA